MNDGAVAGSNDVTRLEAPGLSLDQGPCLDRAHSPGDWSDLVLHPVRASLLDSSTYRGDVQEGLRRLAQPHDRKRAWLTQHRLLLDDPERRGDAGVSRDQQGALSQASVRNQLAPRAAESERRAEGEGVYRLRAESWQPLDGDLRAPGLPRNGRQRVGALDCLFADHQSGMNDDVLAADDVESATLDAFERKHASARCDAFGIDDAKLFGIGCHHSASRKYFMHEVVHLFELATESGKPRYLAAQFQLHLFREHEQAPVVTKLRIAWTCAGHLLVELDERGRVEPHERVEVLSLGQ